MNDTVCSVSYRLNDHLTQRFPGRCWVMPSIDRCLQSKILMAVSLSRGMHVDPHAYWQHLYVCNANTTLTPVCCPIIDPEYMRGLVLNLRFHVITLMADAAAEQAVTNLPEAVDIATARLNRTHTNMDIRCSADDAETCASYAMTLIRDYVYGFHLDSFLLTRVEGDGAVEEEEVRLYDLSYLCIALGIVILIAACVYYGRRKHRQATMNRAYRMLD